MTDLASLVVRLEAEIGKYQENLDKATRQLHKFQSDAEGFLGKITEGFVAFFTVDKAIEWGKTILENGDHLAKFSQSTGVAVDELSRLTYAMKASGANAESLGKVFTKLNDSISDAAGNAKSASGVAFRQMGVDVRTATGQLKTADVVIKEIADKFQGYQDGANKSALATALLGKAGDSLIPFLNLGSEGIKKLADESDRLGATWDGATAKAAEEFESKLGRLKTALFDGIGNRIAKELLPVLNNLGDRFEQTAHGAELMDGIARTLATGLKLLVSAGVIVANVFETLGKYIGAAAAVFTQVIQGNFEEASSIADDFFSDTVDQAKDGWKDINAIWKDGSDEILSEVVVTAQKIKEQAPNLAGGLALQQAADKAIAKLREMAQQLSAQVQTFGLSESAVIKYRLATGDLAQVVKDGGAAGRKYAETIQAQADALDRLKDTKAITDGLAAVNSQILALQGDSSGALIADFDAKNFELVTKLRHAGNVEGQKQLDLLLTLQVAQSDFNELNDKAASIQSALNDQEERLRNTREAGALTELQYQSQLSEARTKAANDLAGIAAAQEKIAAQTGNPKMLEGVHQLESGIANLRAQTDLLEKSLRNTFSDAAGTFLKSFIKDVHSAGDAFEDFLDTIVDQILSLATQQIGQQLTQALFGSSSSAGGSGGGGGGFLGNVFGAIAGAFAGGKAAGGDVQAGMAYRVNEKTAKSEWFVPRTAGRVVQNGMGGQQVQQNFTIQAPQGTVSRQTQMQVGAAAARGLGEASRRNN